MNEPILFRVDHGVARLTLNRPEKRNALRREMLEAMLAAVQELQQERSLRAFVLDSVGDVFCAGMDLGQMQERATQADSKSEWQKDSQVFCELLKAIHLLPVPTIAVLQGPALAGGMGLVLACDIVLASDNVFFMLPEPMRGITAAMVTPLLIHRVGAGPATYLLLSNERISAAVSKQFGLCHDVVSSTDLVTRLEQLLLSIQQGSATAFAITKRHVAACTSYDLVSQIEDSIAVSAQARETEDAREGLAAFLEKRKPAWQIDVGSNK